MTAAWTDARGRQVSPARRRTGSYDNARVAAVSPRELRDLDEKVKREAREKQAGAGPVADLIAKELGVEPAPVVVIAGPNRPDLCKRPDCLHRASFHSLGRCWHPGPCQCAGWSPGRST